MKSIPKTQKMNNSEFNRRDTIIKNKIIFNMKNSQTFTFLFLGLMLIFGYSCKKDDSSPGGEIKAGILLPITGDGSSQGECGDEAIRIAKLEIEQYLADLYSGFTISIVVEDTQTDTAVAIQQYNKLKNMGIRLIVGPYTSAELKALKPLADRDGILLVSPASVATSLSVAGDNVFRMVPDTYSQAEALVALLSDDTIKTLVPVVRDDIWGNELLTAISGKFTATGGQVHEPIKYSPSNESFESVVQELVTNVDEALTSHPASEIGIYLVSYDEGTEILSLAKDENSLNQVRWYGSSGYATENSLVLDLYTAVFAMNRSLSCPMFGFDPGAKPKWEPLKNELQTSLGRVPDIYAFAAYDAIWLATMTFLKTGVDADIETLKASFMAEAENFYGVSGWNALNTAGDRAWATYDFWGIKWQLNAPVWSLVANYNNGSGILTRY